MHAQNNHIALLLIVLHGRFALRICVLSFRTHQDRMEQCLADIRESVAALAAETRNRP